MPRSCPTCGCRFKSRCDVCSQEGFSHTVTLVVNHHEQRSVEVCQDCVSPALPGPNPVTDRDLSFHVVQAVIDYFRHFEERQKED